jgi:hypothetical protein
MAEPHQVDLSRVIGIVGPDGVDPRIVAIVGVSYIESYLRELVKSHMPFLNRDLRDRLFGRGGSLRDLSSLIDIARSMNVLTNRGRSEAMKLSHVRNRFAHNVEIDSFDHPDVAKIIDTMDSFRGFGFEEGGFLVDDKDMSRRDVVVFLIREFCIAISSDLSGPGGWEIGEDDLHVEPLPPSPRKPRGKIPQSPESLTNPIHRLRHARPQS